MKKNCEEISGKSVCECHRSESESMLNKSQMTSGYLRLHKLSWDVKLCITLWHWLVSSTNIWYSYEDKEKPVQKFDFFCSIWRKNCDAFDPGHLQIHHKFQSLFDRTIRYYKPKTELKQIKNTHLRSEISFKRERNTMN